MSHIRLPHFRRIAAAASGVMMLLGGTALAQSVRIFDDAPSIEQLRSIMIPESRPGLGRTIVMQRPDTTALQRPVEHAAAQVMPSPRMPVNEDETHAPPVAKAVAAVPASPRAEPMRPAPKQEAAVASGVVGFRINFAFDSDVLPASSFPMIDRIAELMNEAPDMKLRVEGHTDATGTAAYNMALSERRALSVADYLVKQGIDPARLILIGKGQTEPMTENHFDPRNRRVQFVRMG